MSRKEVNLTMCFGKPQGTNPKPDPQQNVGKVVPSKSGKPASINVPKK